MLVYAQQQLRWQYVLTFSSHNSIKVWVEMHTSKRPGIFCNCSHYLSYNRVKENENAIKNLTQVVFHVWPMCHVMCHILTHKMTLLFLVLFKLLLRNSALLWVLNTIRQRQIFFSHIMREKRPVCLIWRGEKILQIRVQCWVAVLASAWLPGGEIVLGMTYKWPVTTHVHPSIQFNPSTDRLSSLTIPR